MLSVHDIHCLGHGINHVACSHLGDSCSDTDCACRGCSHSFGKLYITAVGEMRRRSDGKADWPVNNIYNLEV